MERIDDISTKRRYFAAANGIFGFQNYFARIFDSPSYRRIFVLKGGPGTGKSSLMKKITRTFPDGAYRTEAFFCSSDPDSLDGVTVENARGKVAVLDGTAPHERDAVIPGAIDEIVNLGEAWDSEVLKHRREEILKLTKKKQACYAAAYRYLAAFGKTVQYSEAENEKCDLAALHERIRELLLPRRPDDGGTACRLIRGFGCRGEVLLPTFCLLSERVLLLRGSAPHRARVLHEVLRIFEEDGLRAVVAPSPLDPRVLDGVMSETAGIAFLSVGEEGIPFDADEFFAPTVPTTEGEPSLLALAKEHFAMASEHHFALESIYKEAMDFCIIDRKTEDILDAIHRLLG